MERTYDKWVILNGSVQLESKLLEVHQVSNVQSRLIVAIR